MKLKTLNQKLTASLLTLTVIGFLVVSIFQAIDNTPHAKAAWYSNDWNYRQKIIIDHNKVPNTDQTDFPVLIKITDANNPIFSSKVQDDGDDIRFTSTDQTTILNHEIESYSKDTHELWAWVKVPTLSYTTDTNIYLYYGNSSATDPGAAFHQAVWSNGYAGVWHMEEASGDQHDSTVGTHVGVDNVSATGKTGKIGFGQQFDGVDDYLNTDLNVSGSVKTVSTWINYDASAYYQVLISQWYSPASWQLALNPNVQYSSYNGSSGSSLGASSGTGDSNWHRISAVYTGGVSGTNIKMYIDGVPNNSGTINVEERNVASGLWIGRENGSSIYGPFKGYMDEPQVTSVARSADWIATEYANQNSPETFYTIRSEVNKATGLAQVNPNGWYDSEWGSRQPISLNNTRDKVPNTNQTDFPALVKITDVNNPLFDFAQSSGNDILFTDATGTTKLAHEIEKYDPATHELWAWVKIPTLLTGADTQIYMYYGNSSASSQQSKAAVWSNGYVAAWHMNNDADETESSANGYNLTETGTVGLTPGKINNARNWLSNGNNYLSKTDAPNLDNLANYTISGWFYYTGGNDAARAIISKRVGPSNQASYSIFRYTDGKLHIYSPYSGFEPISNAVISPNNWYFFSVSYDGSRADNLEVELYLNGQFDISGDGRDIIPDTSSKVHIGTLNDAYATSWLGSIDDIKLASTARSADWIATEYNNQNSPETFMSFGTTETADSFAPNNPSSVIGYQSSGGTAIANNSGTDSTPYYSWPEPEVAGGATDQTGEYISGVAGYYSYFGTSCGAGGADPASARGVLSDTGGGVHFSSDTNVSIPDLTTNEEAYCLRLRTKDIAGNVSATAEVATYNFDLTNPNPPTFIAVNPAGYSSVDSFDFTWPTATDVGGAGSGTSGIQGYQYKRGNGTDEWSAIQSSPKVTGITHYNQTGGENIFLVRSVDNAGNLSTEVQTTYYYSNDVPLKPTSITPTPALSEENSFSFSWEPPANPTRPIVDYGYSINAIPTVENLTWTNNSSTTLSAGPYATVQGVNTIYIVAKDDSGAYGLNDTNYGTATFNCTTVAPPIPTQMSIVDSSDRLLNRYMLTIQWAAGANQNQTSFDHYAVERSTDPQAESGEGFSQIATTSATAYIDTSLNSSTNYYYRVKAIDNAASPSASSQIVSKIPTGKFTTPPTIVNEPAVTTTATTATISWVVSRSSTSAVRFGKSDNDLSRSQIDPTNKTSQTVSLVGLESNTTYYYQVQSLDADRDYSSDSAYSTTYSFKTLPSPSISNVTVSGSTLSSVDITWETTSAANTEVQFGPTISYGSVLSEPKGSMTTMHTVKLKDLTHTTKYHYKISGIDIDGNPLVSDDYTFETLPLPKISQINYQTNFEGPAPEVTISWITNVPTTSSVNYTPVSPEDTVSFEESQSALVKEHKVTLSKMKNDIDYTFTLSGRDQFGNLAQSDQQILNAGLDLRPPTVSDVNVETSNIGLASTDKARLVISWKTDEPGTSEIEYDEGVAGTTYRKKIQGDSGLAFDHVIVISGLKPQAPYHFRVISKDKDNNTAQSPDRTVITSEITGSVFNIVAKTLASLFGWLGKVLNL